MDFNLCIQQLEDLKNHLNCPICSKKCVNPIRIKTCGQYFCADCLDTTANICPDCGEYFSEDANELERDNLAIKTEDLLNKLKTFLVQGASLAVPENDTSLEVGEWQGPSFTFLNKQYNIEYVDTMDIKINAKGESILHRACQRNNLNQVKQLIQDQLDINVKDFAGWAPLHEAIEIGSEEIAKILLKHGALVNVPGGNYMTPLHKAIDKGHANLVELLLQYGADIDVIDFNGCKPADYINDEAVRRVFNDTKPLYDVPHRLFLYKHINVYCHTILKEYREKLRASKYAAVKDQFSVKRHKITHLLVKVTHKISLKILIAMVEGLYFAPQEWIDEFLAGNHFIDIPNYTFFENDEINRGVKRSMMNSLLKRPKLFDGINFYVANTLVSRPIVMKNMTIDKAFLNQLIISGGGQILKRTPTPSSIDNNKCFPYHVKSRSHLTTCYNFIIFDENRPPDLQYNMPELKHRPTKWLVDCVVKFSISD